MDKKSKSSEESKAFLRDLDKMDVEATVYNGMSHMCLIVFLMIAVGAISYLLNP